MNQRETSEKAESDFVKKVHVVFMNHFGKYYISKIHFSVVVKYWSLL